MIIIKCTGKRIDGALKEYRQKVDRTGQMKELKERREFEKPSVTNRKIKQRAQYKARYENT